MLAEMHYAFVAEWVAAFAGVGVKRKQARKIGCGRDRESKLFRCSLDIGTPRQLC